MSLRRSRWIRLLLVVLFMASSFASPAMAAKKGEEKLPPYDVNAMKHQKIWVPWVFAFLFAAGGVVVAFKNPHRNVSERD